MDRLKTAFATLRARRPFVDHLVRTVQRYQADTGDRLASSVTFYWFLSLFPILLIAVYVTSLVLGDSAGLKVTNGLEDYLGRPTAQSIGEVVQENAGKAGLVGLAGTLLSGLGWIEALRDAIRTMWHQNTKAGNIVTRKVADVVALVGLFAVIAASVVVSGAATAATGDVLDFLDLSESLPAKALTIGLSYLLGFFVDLGVFFYLFVRLARVPTPLREVAKGAVFGAVGFEVLKAFGAYYIGRTTSKGEATYGTFAVVVGLLLFLNLVSRLVLMAAAFTVTAPGDSDTRPSGTADPEQARKAGIPQEYADSDINLQEEGAPTPLRAAVQGRMEDVPGPVEQSWARRQGAPAMTPAAPVPAPPAVPLKGAAQVRLAAGVLAALGALVTALVGLHAVRTAKGLVRR